MAKQSKSKEFSEIDDIKEDLNSLRTNVVELTKHVQENGADRASKISSDAKVRLKQLNKAGKKQVERMEGRVKEKPGQSVAIAFVAGLLTSALLARR